MIKPISLITLALFVFFACSSNELITPILDMEDNVLLSITGEEKTITVTCNTNWTATCNDSWCGMNLISGNGPATICLTAGPNMTGKTRVTYIYLEAISSTKRKSSSITSFVTVIQPSVEIKVSPSYSFPVAGGVKQIPIVSNIAWTASSDKDWCQLGATSGEGDASFSITAAPNTGSSERTGIITLSTAMGISKTITVTQTEKWQIGELYPSESAAQGIVFWVDNSGKHGWLLSLKKANNSTECAWGPANFQGMSAIAKTYESNAIADTAGSANTLYILPRLYSNEYAAKKINTIGGWYLPAAGQLYQLFTVFTRINSVIDNINKQSPGTADTIYGSYWSSTGYISPGGSSIVRAWHCHFSQYVLSPIDWDTVISPFYVRAVRSF